MRIPATRFCLAILALLYSGPQWLRAASFDPSRFQQPDGAVALNPGGNYVEPYFATKALIVAQDGGLDVRRVALAWIEWNLSRQRSNGLFRRFCRVKQEWQDCAPADADERKNQRHRDADQERTEQGPDRTVTDVGKNDGRDHFCVLGVASVAGVVVGDPMV